MMICCRTIFLSLVAASFLSSATAFSSSPAVAGGRRTSTTLFQTGGWGIGSPRDLTPEEYGRGERRNAYEGYKVTDQADFLQQVREEQDSVQEAEIKELLAVAKFAGIDTTKLEKKRKQKFDDTLMEEDDDLDVSI